MRRTIRDGLLSACAVAILLIVLVTTDGRVREQISANMNGPRASAGIAATTTQAHVLIHVIKDQSEQHGPLLIMVVIGTMLALFMFRT